MNSGTRDIIDLRTFMGPRIREARRLLESMDPELFRMPYGLLGVALEQELAAYLRDTFHMSDEEVAFLLAQQGAEGEVERCDALADLFAFLTVLDANGLTGILNASQ